MKTKLISSFSINKIFLLFLLLFLTTIHIIYGNFKFVSFLLILLVILLLTTIKFIFFENCFICKNKARIYYDKIQDYYVAYPSKKHTNFINICLLIKDGETIKIIIKNRKKTIDLLLKELYIRTGKPTNPNISYQVNAKKHKELLSSSILLVLLILPSFYINFHDYIFCPFKFYDKNIWVSGDFTHLKYFYDKHSIPSYEQIKKNYNEYNFYVCMYSNCYYRNMISQSEKEDTNNFCLELSYSTTNYIEAEKNMLTQNTFLQNTIWNYDHSQLIMPTNYIKIGKFSIKIVFNKDYDERYYVPNELVFIAYDGESRIRYCYQNELSRLYINSEQDLINYILKGFRMPW